NVLEELRQQGRPIPHRPRLACIAEEAEGPFDRPPPETGRALAPPDPIVGAVTLLDHLLDQIVEFGGVDLGPSPGLIPTPRHRSAYEFGHPSAVFRAGEPERFQRRQPLLQQALGGILEDRADVPWARSLDRESPREVLDVTPVDLLRDELLGEVYGQPLLERP